MMIVPDHYSCSHGHSFDWSYDALHRDAPPADLRCECGQITFAEIGKGVTCDVCQKEYTETLETQEFHHLIFEGGFNSIFGDMARFELHLCQHCLKQKLGPYAKITPMEYDEFSEIDEIFGGEDAS